MLLNGWVWTLLESESVLKTLCCGRERGLLVEVGLEMEMGLLPCEPLLVLVVLYQGCILRWANLAMTRNCADR